MTGPRFLALPEEILLAIMRYLNVMEMFSLGASCKRLSYINLHDETCRKNLENHAPFSNELKRARKIGAYARAWRSLAKRLFAVTTATPWFLSVVALSSEFIYNDGVLVYTVEQYIKVLHLWGQVKDEITIDTQKLLQAAQLDHLKFKGLKLLHYACCFVTCLIWLSDGDAQYWLVTCHTKQAILTYFELSVTRGIFVRNSEDYLYFGVLVNRDSNQVWDLRQINIRSALPRPSPPFTAPFEGEVGRNTCFRIIDSHFYGVSVIQASVDDLPLRSSYSMVRFRLSDHAPKVLDAVLLTRKHWDGESIDSRWSTIDIEQCVNTGGVFISETGQEMTKNGNSQRFHYRKDIQSSPGGHIEDGPVEYHFGTAANRTDTPVSSYPHQAKGFLDLIKSSDIASYLQLRIHLSTPCATSQSLGYTVWPPSAELGVTPYASAAFQILNPYGDGAVKAWSFDDRNLLYLIGRRGHTLPMLVLISFDPQLQLIGLKDSLKPSPENIGKHANTHMDLSNEWSARTTPFYLSFSRQLGIRVRPSRP